MPGIAAQQRDWEAVRAGLGRWLAGRWPHAGDLRIGPLDVSEANGFSNETVFFDATFSTGDGEVTWPLIARLPPLGGGLFPVYDLETQWRVQDRVGQHGIPVAGQVGFEADEVWVGSPFIVMERVAGRVPGDNPLYCVSGWLAESSPSAQRTACESAVEALAAIHRLDWSGLGLSFVARSGGPGLAGELAWWGDYLQWASDGAPGGVLADALAWCHANRPTPEPPASLLWGDARLGNVMFGSDLRPAALFDWEMASIGPPEVDVGWFTATRTQTRMLAGGLPDPELPGFLDRAATIARYEQAVGRPLQDLEWYEVFAMLRWGTCIASIHRLLRHLGITDHFIFDSPLLPDWTIELMEGRP